MGRRDIQHFSFLFLSAVNVEETCHRSRFWGHLDVYSRYLHLAKMYRLSQSAILVRFDESNGYVRLPLLSNLFSMDA